MRMLLGFFVFLFSLHAQAAPATSLSDYVGTYKIEWCVSEEHDDQPCEPPIFFGHTIGTQTSLSIAINDQGSLAMSFSTPEESTFDIELADKKEFKWVSPFPNHELLQSWIEREDLPGFDNLEFGIFILEKNEVEYAGEFQLHRDWDSTKISIFADMYPVAGAFTSKWDKN